MLIFKRTPIVHFVDGKIEALSPAEFINVIKLIRVFAGREKAREVFDKYCEFKLYSD